MKITTLRICTISRLYERKLKARESKQGTINKTDAKENTEANDACIFTPFFKREATMKIAKRRLQFHSFYN